MHAPTLNLELPDWPGAKVFFSTRAGGVSAAPYHHLNLGDHVGDDPAAVAVNRARLAAAWGVQPVFLTQTHGTDVIWLEDRKSTRLNSSHIPLSRMPSSA